jgi:hypothetical protein
MWKLINMSEPTLDEVFPYLHCIHGASIEECKAAYDRLDTSSPGHQVEDMTEDVLAGGSVRAFLEMRWPHIKTVVVKYPPDRFKDLALAAEYLLRQSKT